LKLKNYHPGQYNKVKKTLNQKQKYDYLLVIDMVEDVTDKHYGWKKGNIDNAFNRLQTWGLNQENTLNQIKQGTLTLNATVENFDANSVNYKMNLVVILYLSWRICFSGEHFINEQNKHIFPYYPSTQESQIGFMENNDCVYNVLIKIL
jgi:hypothetical protein